MKDIKKIFFYVCFITALVGCIGIIIFAFMEGSLLGFSAMLIFGIIGVIVLRTDFSKIWYGDDEHY